MPPPQHTNPAFRQSLAPTSAYSRHLSASAAQTHIYRNPAPPPARARTERDILEDHHRFLRPDDEQQTDEEKALARKYYDKLYKQYAVVELSRWRDGMVGMRWRTEKEVKSGKGERVCGAIGCGEVDNMKCREVVFDYEEDGDPKKALVKVWLCRDCRRSLEKAQSTKGNGETNRSTSGKNRRKRDRDEDDRRRGESRERSRRSRRDAEERLSSQRQTGSPRRHRRRSRSPGGYQESSEHTRSSTHGSRPQD